MSSIAAASIIAKVYRDNYMQELSIQEPGYDWDHNMGTQLGSIEWLYKI